MVTSSLVEQDLGILNIIMNIRISSIYAFEPEGQREHRGSSLCPCRLSLTASPINQMQPQQLM